MSNKFDININCIVLTTDLSLNKKYVLSLDPEKIIPPSFSLDYNHLTSQDFDNDIIQFLKQYIFTSDIELLPQLICLNTNTLYNNENKNTLNVIYGFIITKTNSLNTCYWLEFDYLSPTEITPLLIEVIQKLK